ncbi:hypothetical protein ABK040_006718 [Willaertia magna]
MKVFVTAILLAIFIVAFAESGALKRNRHIGALNHGRNIEQQRLLLKKSLVGVDQWMEQQLDHYDPTNTETFQQRFWVNATAWNKQNNGPVFIIIGGEGPASEGYINGHFIATEYAQRYGAMVAALEHRFYGKSVPRNSLSTANLRYLSSQQALSDLVSFRKFLITKFGINESATKFVLFGGSYSGNLSAWGRLKFPNLFAASLASSGPVLAQLEFKEYMEVVARSVGPACAARVRQANDMIETLLKTPAGKQRVTKMFNICNPNKLDNDNDLALLFMSLSDGVCEVVQYNLDNNGRNTYNTTNMCQIIQSGSDVLESFATWVNTWNKYSGNPCTENDYDEYIQELKDTRPWPENGGAAGRSWTYQTCVEFGYYQNAVGSSQPFSPRITLEWYLQQCQQLFGVNDVTPHITFTNDYYGAKGIDTSNTVFTFGNIDPWHILGLTSPNNYVGQQNIYFMQGTAHCADLYASSPNDLPTLKNTRQQTIKLFDQWLL